MTSTIDPRDYTIIRALGALSLNAPNVELARAFLSDSGAGERIHAAVEVVNHSRAKRDAQIAWQTAYEIRDRMSRVLDRQLDEKALELIEDIAAEYSMAHHQNEDRQNSSHDMDDGRHIEQKLAHSSQGVT